MLKDSRSDEQRAAWDAEDGREDLEELVTKQSEISEQEAVKIKSEENERRCGKGNRGFLWGKKGVHILCVKLYFLPLA